ncbi:MAG: serine hydrolase domain-containing protein [Acetobacteraceae bacterium]|nr:serine hydrolase domain-containing protein [Acetobacteraceae bacterium]
MRRILLAGVFASLSTLGLSTLGLSAPASAADLPRADPASIGLDPHQLDAITTKLDHDIADHLIPGAVLIVMRHGKVGYEHAFGHRGLPPDAEQAGATQQGASGEPMQSNDIFRIYSMSKPITVAAALTLIEAGKLRLDDPVAKYLPEFKTMQVGVPDPSAPDGMKLEPAKSPITVQDLFRHSAGLTYGFFGDTPVKKAYLKANLEAGDPDLATFVERLAKLPLGYQPGTTWDYSYAIDVIGRIVEVVSGQSLYDYEKQHVLGPLDMQDTGFGVPDAARQGRIAEPFANDRNFGVNADFSDPRHPVKMQSGGGGMTSTAEDYARFLQAMANGGTLDGHRILHPQTVRMMTSDQLGSVKPGPYYLPGPGYGFGLGVAVRTDAGVAPFPGDVGDWYWGGAGGTYMWVDPARELVVVWMMQSPKQRLPYRSLLRDMVNAALVD